MRNSFSLYLGGFLTVAALASAMLPHAVFAEDKIGVVGAVNPSTRINNSAGATIATIGADIHANDTVITDAAGNAQLLFVDKSALTVGANSKLVIDKFVFDPASQSGQLSVEGAKGVFRFVGGALSKKTPVLIKTPVSTIGIRGGIALVEVDAKGETNATFVYGTEMTVQNLNGDIQRTTVPGSGIQVMDGFTPPTVPVKVSADFIAGKVEKLEGKEGTNSGAREVPTTQTVRQKLQASPIVEQQENKQPSAEKTSDGKADKGNSSDNSSSTDEKQSDSVATGGDPKPTKDGSPVAEKQNSKQEGTVAQGEGINKPAPFSKNEPPSTSGELIKPAPIAPIAPLGGVANTRASMDAPIVPKAPLIMQLSNIANVAGTTTGASATGTTTGQVATLAGNTTELVDNLKIICARNARGFDCTGRHLNGTFFDARGFNMNGIHKNGTPYDAAGLDVNGLPKPIVPPVDTSSGTTTGSTSGGTTTSSSTSGTTTTSSTSGTTTASSGGSTPGTSTSSGGAIADIYANYRPASGGNVYTILGSSFAGADSAGLVNSTGMIQLHKMPSNLRCNTCSFVDWGVWQASIPAGTNGVENVTVNPNVVQLAIVGQLNNNLSTVANLGNVTYEGLVLGHVATASTVGFQTGQFSSVVNLGMRQMTDFEGTIGDYSFGFISRSDTFPTFGPAVISDLALENFGGAASFNTGTLNKVGLFGSNAENMAGTFKLETTSGSVRGIFLGAR